MQNNRTIWLIVLSTVLFLGAALVTLRAAEQANRPTAVQASGPVARAPALSNPATSPTPGMPAAPASTAAGSATGAASATRAKPTHPPASAPEESATITDDPTTAPDPSQSADNNVSFPTDI